MATEIRIQKLSDTMEEGTLLKWHKKPGDTIEFDEDLADVETDKATMALTASEGGILHAIYVEEGAKVPVGSLVALILDEGEEPPAEGTVQADAPAAAAAKPVEPAAAESEATPSTPTASLGFTHNNQPTIYKQQTDSLNSAMENSCPFPPHNILS